MRRTGGPGPCSGRCHTHCRADGGRDRGARGDHPADRPGQARGARRQHPARGAEPGERPRPRRRYVGVAAYAAAIAPPGRNRTGAQRTDRPAARSNLTGFPHWLNAEQIGAQFGPAASDLQAITTWLVGNGFTVNTVYPSGMVIDFSGTAGPVRTAFHTEIHNLVVNGKEHIANINDPQIPAALTPAVAGIVSLHDFRPKPQYSYTSEWGETAGNTYYYLVPADLWTIYNFNPLFSAGITGQGQTITVVEHSDPYTYNPVTGDDPDWDTFRSKFGLSPYGGELTVQHPAPTSGPNNCADPSYDPNKDPLEAALDPEWASAAAPDASIVV